MTLLPDDPLQVGGIVGFGRCLRRGETSAEAVTAAYLSRIEVLEPRLQAFEHIDADDALATARALDSLLGAGTDLGPLMGVPVAIKDIIAVAGMPTRTGSNLDVTDIIGPEGPFVRALRRAGCVILGKAMTEEFARGGPTGLNPIRGTPWNPWDTGTHRIPGGSSSGSGVAMAAGLCGFAIGSDTGGSVRLPAAFCGVFGVKPTWGMWPLDGVYPTCPSLDTLGLLTRSADDAAIVVSALSDIAVLGLDTVRGLRLGRPTHHFFDNLDAEVEACVSAALVALEKEGAVIVDVEFSEIEGADDFFRVVIGGEFLAGMGRERFLADREAMGFILAARGASGLDVMADAYVQQRHWQDTACRVVADKLRDLDAVVTPTIPILPAPASDFPDLERATRLAVPISKNTYFANMFRLCATTMPVHHFGSTLPVGLQLNCAEGEDGKLLAIGRAVEQVIGAPAAPDLKGFLP